MRCGHSFAGKTYKAKFMYTAIVKDRNMKFKLMNRQATSSQSKLARIAYLTSVHIPFDIRIFYKELRSLSKAGYEVVLIAPHTRDEVVDGIRVRAVPKPRGRFQRMFRTALQVVWLAWQENADLYQIHDPELLLWSQILRLRGKTVIFDMHENVPKDILSKEWISPALRRIVVIFYQGLERILLWRMPVIFAENSYVRDYKWIDRRNTVILNMPLVEDLLAISEPRHALPTVGYIGAVNADRGSMITLQALDLLNENGYRVGFECVGRLSESHQNELELFADSHNLESIHYYGHMVPHDGYRVIARCHIGLAVLTPLPNAIGSYPTKIFEYMALGLPVIVSGFPLYREVVESAGCGLCLNDPTNPLELAAAMRWMLERPDDAAEMGNRGRDAVLSQYNWNSEERKLLNFYALILQQYEKSINV